MRKPLALALLALVAATTLLLPGAAGQDVADKVEKILNRIEETNGADLWGGIRELEELGRAAIPEMRKGLSRANPFPRIAIAKVLYGADFKDEALETLGKVVSGSKLPAARKAAAEMTAALVGTDAKLDAKQKRALADGFRSQADEIDDELARIQLYRAVWLLTETIEPKRKIRDLLEKSAKREVKDDAALALAEMDAFLWAQKHLKELAEEPSDRGRLARAYLKNKRIQDELTRAQSKGDAKYDYKMLDEIIDKLKTFYHDPAKVDEAKLIEAAARGMLGSLDPYTAFYDEKTIEQLKKEDLEGHYGGIGARVNMRKDKNGTAWLTITEPIFSGPAYKAGLRSNDMITEIEGESTANKEVSDCVRRLRGKPGTKVKFKVFRRGWPKEREFAMDREEIQLETTMGRMLPGDIGYIKYTTFGDLDDELKLKKRNIETLTKDLADKGMKALILDLRGNSGGYLRTARRIASLFLPKGALIVTTRARGEEKDKNESSGGPYVETPHLIVLVDGESASASEILAGALQDHRRAIVIGEKTFGKGSVQDLKYLETMQEKTAARITIAKWFLPNGASVEKDDAKEGGVKPDVVVAFAERDLWKEAEFEKLRADGKLEEYVTKSFAGNRDLFRQLADADGGDPSRYPGFDAVYDGLGTKLSKAETRELLREYVRQRVQDDQGQALYLDFQVDVQLQRAIMEACKKAGVDHKTIKEYGTFAAAEKK